MAVLMREALHLIVGGFLGAGKTTAIRIAARHLAQRGRRVAIITNDQSRDLVDTALLRADGFPVEEVTGGCFCCRFDAFVGAVDALAARARPDVFISEPVGSCTDLVATVTTPLGQRSAGAGRGLPLSVVVDPIRAERMLGLEPGRNFSPRVLYVYAKQLEEAGAIVINKCDLIGRERQDRLETALRRACGRAEIFRMSARTGAGVADWIDRWIAGGAGVESVAGVDYGRYAEGEAELGWVNASVVLQADRDIDGNDWLRTLAAAIRASLDRVEIAHLKVILVPEGQGREVGAISLTRTDTPPEASHVLTAPTSAGRVLINLRAEAAPDLLWQVVSDALAACGCRTSVEHVEHFRPQVGDGSVFHRSDRFGDRPRAGGLSPTC
jgi:G3E family GTPase